MGGRGRGMIVNTRGCEELSPGLKIGSQWSLPFKMRWQCSMPPTCIRKCKSLVCFRNLSKGSFPATQGLSSLHESNFLPRKLVDWRLFYTFQSFWMKCPDFMFDSKRQADGGCCLVVQSCPTLLPPHRLSVTCQAPSLHGIF